MTKMAPFRKSEILEDIDSKLVKTDYIGMNTRLAQLSTDQVSGVRLVSA